MISAWTPDAVLALAPDPGAAKSAQGLAAVRQWAGLGRHDFALWGEITGSGANPYQARIDLREPAFKCSCPSRKFPCKHGLALLLVFAREPAAFAPADPPAWVSDWLASRNQRTAKRDEKPAAAVVDVAAQEKRAEKREARVAAGLDELGVWLRDLVRAGLAQAQTPATPLWDRMASRLVDAQAPGLARLVRRLDDAAHSGPGWETRLLHGVARLEMIRHAYARVDELPPGLADDVRAAVGWTTPQDEVLGGDGVRDRWRALGTALEADDRMRVRRTWLCGRASGRQALLLDFAVGSQPLDAGVAPGSELDAELCFYPGALGLRAIVKSQGPAAPGGDAPSGSGTIEDALTSYADALARVPWLERWPVSLRGVHWSFQTSRDGQPEWSIADADGARLRLPPRFAHGWHLMAIAGGQPLDLFGEWDGEFLRPLTCGGAGASYALGTSVVPLRRDVPA